MYSYAHADSNTCSASSSVSQPLLPNSNISKAKSIVHDKVSVVMPSPLVQAQPLLSNNDTIASQSSESDSTSVTTNNHSRTQCTLEMHSVFLSESLCMQSVANDDIVDENTSGNVHYNPSDAAKDCIHNSASSSFLE